ncbi:putative DNA polymerase delta catalytic subunit [Blattamonas nauphoetae]|uniref:DNA polymerase delta catalytic subunit n=1 Tax=Blattamonas nauphoetae TaxID=2049346 RepID=A0ABQ9YFH8_9EUKA|nr:putative DNA polymerase delta catalytic subunit [Blattamonas nauphoetae]
MSSLRFTTSSDYSLFQRQTPEVLQDNTSPLIFQWIDADYTVAKVPYPGMPGSKQGEVPVVRFYGITAEGYSVIAHCHGFTPYLYIQSPPRFTDANIESLKAALNAFAVVHSIIKCRKKSLYHYQAEDAEFLKIYVQVPSNVPKIRGELEKGVNIEGYGARSFLTYESNIDFVLRFLFDTKAFGSCWMELPKEKYYLRKEKDTFPRTGTALYEADIAYSPLCCFNLSISSQHTDSITSFSMIPKGNTCQSLHCAFSRSILNVKDARVSFLSRNLIL